MATLRTVTVKSSGGDYSSLSAAEAGEQANLVSLDRQLDIECYSMSDTTAVVVAGWTSDATRYIRIYTPSTERHDGKWNTSKYRLEVSNTDCLAINEEYVRIDGLQLRKTATSAGFQDCIDVSTIAAGGSDIRIENCILRQAGNASFNEVGLSISDADATVTVRNCICYGDGASGTFSAALWVNNASSATIQNCTLIGGKLGLNVTAGTVTATNVYAAVLTSANCYQGTMTRTTCAHNSASSFSGSTASVAHSTSNFVNVTAGSEDYHLAVASALINAGTDLSGSFTTDIDGQTRPTGASSWDIGADEWFSASNTYNETASGGARPGSSAVVFLVSTKIASGGGQLAGTAPPGRISSLLGTGGGQCGSTALLAKISGLTSSGGAILAGSAPIYKSCVVVATGGAVLSGTAHLPQIFIVSASGGCVIGGTSTLARTFIVTASGGIVIAGNAINDLDTPATLVLSAELSVYPLFAAPLTVKPRFDVGQVTCGAL